MDNTFYKILQCDDPSPYTGRIYPKEEILKAVEKYQAKIANDTAFGTFDVYNKYPVAGEMCIADISHKITSMHVTEDGEVLVSIEILTTPSGEFLKAAGPENFRLAPSMIGKVSEDMIASDLEIFSTAWLLPSPRKSS